MQSFLRFGILSIVLASLTPQFSWASTTNKTLMYSDTFESYTNGTVLNGVGNWYTTNPDAKVQTNTVYAGSKAAELPTDCSITNQITCPSQTNIWLDMYMRVVRYDGTNSPTIDTNSSAFFYVNSNGYFVVRDGSVPEWCVVTNTCTGTAATPVSESAWLHLELYMNYSNKTWNLMSDGIRMKEDIGFVNSGIEKISEMSIYNGAGNSYMDDVNISSANISPTPDLGISTSSLYAAAMKGYTTTNSFSVYNSNARGTVRYYVSNQVPWITVSPSSGTSTGELDTITVNCSSAGLTGTNIGTVKITGIDVATGNAVLGSPRTLRVTLAVYSGPSLDVTPNGVTNVVAEGYDAGEQSFSIWNGTKSGTLAYVVTDNVPWMAVSPTNGSCTTETDDLTILYSTANLDPGTYEGTISIRGTDAQYGETATNSPQEVTVSLTVEPRAVLQISETLLSRDILQGHTATTQYFTVVNNSAVPKGDMDFSVSESISWLKVSTTNGTITSDTSTVAVIYNTYDLDPGEYRGVISIAATDVETGDAAVNSPLEIEVILVVNKTRGGDFDGSGKAALVVYHEATGQWFIRSVAGDIIAWAVEFGGPGYYPVAGEYTADGVMDLAVYRQTNGNWLVRSLESVDVEATGSCGGIGFTAVPGDYDGDGQREFAVYNGNDGKWYIVRVDGTIMSWAEVWGGVGFLPVPADYDGDGDDDLGVYNPGSGMWYVKEVQGAIMAWAENWGGPGLVPVVGDYNGDGSADLGVYDEANGKWYVRTLQGVPILWGLPWGGYGFEPVLGDYNGDGADDIAVYNSITGRWYIYSLSGSVVGWDLPWGGPGFGAVGSMD